MRLIYLYSIAIVLMASAAATAQKRKSPGASGAPQVIEATVQRTLSGRHESEPRTNYRFVIIWKNHTSPGVFYWRPDAKTWRDVSIAKPEQRPGLGPNDFMIVERNIKYGDIHNGDKIIVTPHSHSDTDEEMPAELRKMPVSCLYYKMGNKWMYVPVKPVKRPDIAMP